MDKFSLEEWFSIIYGPSKNVIEQNESGEWDMVMWAPDIIENLQKPLILNAISIPSHRCFAPN